MRTINDIRNDILAIALEQGGRRRRRQITNVLITIDRLFNALFDLGDVVAWEILHRAALHDRQRAVEATVSDGYLRKEILCYLKAKHCEHLRNHAE